MSLSHCSPQLLWLFKLNPLCLELSPLLSQPSLILIALLNLLLQHLSYALVGRGKEMIGQYYVLFAGEVRIVVNGGVQVEKDRQVHWFLRIEKLVLKAEALDLVEVEGGLLWEDLVNGYSSYRLVWSVVDFVKGEWGLACVHYETGRLGLEFPGKVVLSMGHKRDTILSENVYFVFVKLIFFGMLSHGKAKGLTNHVVKGDHQEEAPE